MNDSWNIEKTLSVDSWDKGLLELESTSDNNSSVIHSNDDWGISSENLDARNRLDSSMAAVGLGDDDDWDSTDIKPVHAGNRIPIID